MTAERLDLGSGHWLEFTIWDPDLDLNPQLAHLADQLPVVCGAIVGHPLQPDDEQCQWRGECTGSIMFSLPVTEGQFGDHPRWTIETWVPLTLSPSLQCHCGDHGHIRGGRWV